MLRTPYHWTMRSRPSLWRGAWIETGSRMAIERALLVAPLFGGGRGLKPDSIDGGERDNDVAPLFGGGRGLKLDPKAAKRDGLGVAPLFGGGRGLKRQGTLP